jgi:hypothetical protein
MTLQKLASLIAKREGKRSQARIGDIREILKIIATLDAESVIENTDMDGPIACLVRYGDKITKRLSKPKRKAGGKCK